MNARTRKPGPAKSGDRKTGGKDPIGAIHDRFIAVMEERLTTVEAETRANYLMIMTSLTAKLEVPGKPLSETVRELMTEAGPLLFTLIRS